MAGDALTRAGVAGRGPADLLVRVGAGDERARRELFTAHGERIWCVLYRILGDYDDAHDITQETFLRAFASAATYQARGSVIGWLSRIALNLARDHLRRRRRRLLLLARPAAPAAAERSSDPLADRRVRAAVDELSEVERVVVLLHDVEGYTHEEIGETLGIATGSSRARLSRARARLRAALTDIVNGGAA